MNKDLDDRLIPNGEYRDAQNISVGKSEADDIGALENVLGNSLATNFGLSVANLKVIGYHSIENSNKIIVFLTDNSSAIPGTSHYIYEFLPSNPPNLLVTGSFLNFSQDYPISGISVIEDLLFWTDNNNQPRKINMGAPGNGTYYTQETDISVAKYSPYKPIGLLNKVKTTTSTSGASTTIAVASTTGIYQGMSVIQYNNINLEAADYIYVTQVNSVSTWNTLVGGTGYSVANDILTTGGTGTGLTVNITAVATGVITGITIAFSGSGYTIGDVITITTGNGNATITVLTTTAITINQSAIVGVGDIWFLATAMTGKDITYNFNNETYNINTWPGDPDYLESRFIRLSYRFEFDDGEYSIMAPFTPITFIPKQKGYFLGSGGAVATPDDENSTYRSTIVEFMENGVQNIELLIPFPDTLNKVQPESGASYKIRSLDILYKESDATVIKVIDTINYDDPGSNWTATSNSNIYVYNYQSRKPFRTLPTNQTIRVYDKVPVKALAQETAGNRIIYGNFLDKYSPPSFLDYVVNVTPKSTSLDYDSWVEFPTQSLKQNRNYQVGFVLADKFGRQSDVILSEVKSSTVERGGSFFGGDTVYSPYNDVNDNTTTPIRNWFGDSLKINIESAITSGQNGLPNGDEPGLYANTGTGYDTWQDTTLTPNLEPTIIGNIYEFNLGGGGQTEIPTIGSYLAGEFTDYVYVENVQPDTPSANRYKVTTIGQISSVYLQQSPSGTDVKYSYTINTIGWYSYKIVVKQQEQDYYNVYLPGILSGYPAQITPVSGVPALFPIGEDGKTANIILINDNINKVPRDLSEVGPQQKQFRSSVQLSGRVNNTATSNKQYFPSISTNTAISISTADDSNMVYQTLTSTGQSNLYQLDSNPLVARLATNSSNPIGIVTAQMVPFLAIYETEPQESLLDIFWETPTTGLISELNDVIATSYQGPVGWEPYDSSSFTESSVGNFLSSLQPVNQSGTALYDTDISIDSNGDPVISSVTNGYGNDVGGQFSVTRTGGPGTGTNDPWVYNFQKVGSNFVYEEDPKLRTYTIKANITNNASTPPITSQLSIVVQLQNIDPVINGGSNLQTLTKSAAFNGVINGTGIVGVNGAASTSLNGNQLQWSMTGGGGYFTINSGDGKITQTNVPAGSYTLVITLKDANGFGTSVSANQQVSVTSTQVGYFFYGYPSGTFLAACPINNASPYPNCSTTPYYSQTALVTGLPIAGSVILDGPQGPGVASPIPSGFYSVGQCATGTDRMVMYIDNNNGIVAVDYPKSCNA
jgi:hypothetical protein